MEQDIKHGAQDMRLASGMEAGGGTGRKLGKQDLPRKQPTVCRAAPVPPTMPSGSPDPLSSYSEPWKDTETTICKM